MKKPDDFHTLSYKIHAANFDDYAHGGKKEAHGKTWIATDSVGAWRFDRMYRLLDPLLESEPEAKWLTVGDGRYGRDAKYLQDKGIDVLATDITGTLLQEAKEMGYLAKYSQENAESLSFKDSTFDFVLCKEAYHHFPRPMVALYEMLRVASKGVVLIEPTDSYISYGYSYQLFRHLINLTKTIFRMKVHRHAFEDVTNNYVYCISRREIEKVALGMNYRVVAFQGINDFYEKGVEYEKLAAKGKLYRKVKFRIALLNILAKIRLYEPVLTVAVIFKDEPSRQLTDELRSAGYDVIQLPKNPYVHA